MEATLVGGALLSAFLQVAFDRLASRQVLYFFREKKLDENLLKKLKRKLRSIHAFADDAELQQFRDQHVRAWLVDVKEVVFEAEDLLDEIYELSKCQVEAESQAQSIDDKVWNFNFSISPIIKGSIVLQKSPSTSLLSESVIYGRNDDKENIISWLTSNTDNKLSVLTIVGMGGLGKTTLVQHVYNDPRVGGYFNLKAWVCVSKDFNVFNLSRAILDTVTKSVDNNRELEIVHARLRRFLLVLDDVWNENRLKWEEVQKPLLLGAQGSRILVTARSTKVASAMRSEIHFLKQLQEDHSWKLFAEHAFSNDSSPPTPDYKEIGTKIVGKCGGLPLALKTIASLLQNKSVLEWKNILQSEIWDLEQSDIIPALALSYHHLPSHLKRCFAYCAIFPKDHKFDKDGLIQLWMDQNFLQCCQHSASPEELGEQYFNDLLSRSFFQQSSENGKDFIMHDLLNDLAKYICGDICFRLGVDQAKDDLYSKFKFIRVLSLSHCCNLTEVPKSVGNLKHLRLLELSNTDIEKLPESTCSLYNLQILKLDNCTHLKEELPSNLLKLTNLCRLELINTELRKVPMHLGKLENLQVLMSSFQVGKSSEFNIQQLGELNLHGSLSIEDLHNIENPLDALAVDLKNKTHLVELELKWDYAWNRDDSTKEKEVTIINYLQPSQHLKKLSIGNYSGKQFPRWLSNNSLSNMVSLRLYNCQSCQCLPPVGLIPFLKELEITGLDGVVDIDTDFYGSSFSSFTSLETLKFRHMEEWNNWKRQDVTGSFPRLQHLFIIECPKLKGHLPEQLHHLKTLVIQNCKQLVTSAPLAPEIRKLDLKDCGKLQFDYHPATLKELTINGYNMEPLLLERLGHFISDTRLEDLWVCSCPIIMTILMSCCHSFLARLTIDVCCDSLMTFHLDFFPTLRFLDLSCCHNLQMISQVHAHNHLQYLKIRKCPKFESLPELIPSLHELYIQDFPKVESFPEGGLPSNLKKISLYNCSKLIASLKGAVGANPSLESLCIGELDVEYFPNEGFCHPLLFYASMVFLILQDSTTMLFSTCPLSRCWFWKTAPTSNACHRRVYPNPFHILKFVAIVHCSNNFARNQKVNIIERLLTLKK
uniref:Disease resistance RPP13-like protein 1 n=1 Tax=Cajanus cajan TaxID=3821 RepID=A0A151QQ50_CAJCA|nr:Putative disease resistance RPP13-like protein 1 [Cajanus cajan]